LEQSGPRKDALRKLSIVFRFLEGPEEKKDCVVKSIELAKQALALDLNDGESWYILGNAHLTNFFTNQTSFDEIEKALKSYSQAIKFLNRQNPDLHFNRALAFNAAERYQEAIQELRIAKALDSELKCDQKESEILENLRNVFEMVQKKCNVKKRTITGLCKTIPSQLKSMQTVQIVPISELQPGKNPKKMLSMRVLGYSNLQFPPIFVACDFKCEFFSLSIYSFPRQSKLALGCTVFVNEPFLVRVEMAGVEYWSVQVRDPNDLMIQNN
jgi:tetratricopeptide (TPR) repeat protein